MTAGSAAARRPAPSWPAVRQVLRLTVAAAPAQLAAQVATALVAAAVPIAAAWLMKRVLDAVGATRGEPGALLTLAGALAAVGVLAGTASHLANYLRAALQRRTAYTATERLFAAVNRLPGLRPFEDPEFLDRLRLAQQASSTAPGRVVESLLGGGQAAVTAAGLTLSLLIVSPKLAFVVLLATVPALLAELALSRRRARVLWAVAPAERRQMFYQLLLVSTEAAKEIRIFGSGRFLIDRMLAERSAADTAHRRLDRRELATQAALAVLGALVAGVGLVWAVTQAWRGVLTVGDIAMLVAAVAGTQAAATSLVGHVAGGHEHLLLFGHFLAVVEAAPSQALPAGDGLLRLRRAIVLRDVWFRYGPDQPWVLRGVNLELPAGRSTALVGRNGAGKSTLIKLLCRFYEPTNGLIEWDGIDIAAFPPERLRASIAVLFQDFMEYDLSAAENIGIGDPGTMGQRDRIEGAAAAAGVHELLVGLPRGYDTMLSRIFFSEHDKDDAEHGMQLSGGQWQRLAVARALLRDDAQLLILDEPSSGLDAEAEHELHCRLRRYRAGRTGLLVSHRLSAVRDADHIVVLVDGCVTERGSHAELVRSDGEYARLFWRQAAGYRDDPVPTTPGLPS